MTRGLILINFSRNKQILMKILAFGVTARFVLIAQTRVKIPFRKYDRRLGFLPFEFSQITLERAPVEDAQPQLSGIQAQVRKPGEDFT
jgi:hypothetical protein